MRPGATGKYVNRPRRKLPASGNGGAVPADITKRLFSQYREGASESSSEPAFHARARLPEALQFDGKTAPR